MKLTNYKLALVMSALFLSTSSIYATADGTDVTSILVNGKFNRTDGWTATKGSFDIDVKKQILEKWWTDWKAEQEVNNVENGIYKLEVQGFQFCHWDWAEAESEWNNGNGSPTFKARSKIKLNDQETIIQNVFACGPTNLKVGYKGSNYYVPNNSDAAISFFRIGLYNNEVQAIVKDNKLKIEFDCSEAGFWNCFYNLRLTYVCSEQSSQYDSICNAINNVDNTFIPRSPKLRSGYANPLVDHCYIADPTAVEYDGRLYVYGTNDSQQYESSDNNSYEKIKTLTIISTDDMVNWTYHGTIPVGTIAPWIYNSWAPSVVSRIEEDGKTHFYLYFSNGGFGTAVLTSTSPVGPWTSPLKKSLVDANTPGLNGCNVPFDPGAVIDDNGVGWIAFGGSTGRIAKLGKDMLSFDSEFINPHAQHHFEANELNFIGGKYVYTYNIDWEDHSDWTLSNEIPTACCMGYMVSSTPLDSTSWVYGNNYLKNAGDFKGFTYTNNHTHLHKYQGKWYVIYHTEMLQDDMGLDGGFRSLQVAEIKVDEQNVHIYPATVDKKGVNQIKPLNPYIVQQAETTAATEGICFKEGDVIGNMIAKVGKAFIRHGMPDNSVIMVRKVDFGEQSSKVSAMLKGKGTLSIHLDSYDSPAVASLNIDSTEWTDVEETCIISGIHNLVFNLEGSLEFDYWRFSNDASSSIKEIDDDGWSISNRINDKPSFNLMGQKVDPITYHGIFLHNGKKYILKVSSKNSYL